MAMPIIYINGLFWPLNKAKVSIHDRGFAYGDGLFETLRMYSSKIFQIDKHLDRLTESSHLIFLELPMTKNEISSAIYSTAKINKLSNSIIRITVTRGTQEPGININHESSPTIVIHARSIKSIPDSTYKNGVAVSSFNNSATRISGIPNPIKSCNYLSNIVLKEKAYREGSFEAIMLDHNNNVAEGTSSNIFIIKNKTLKTPIINEYVLPGITRQVVLELANKNKIHYEEQIITINDLYEADEIFLTNTGFEIMPVCYVNKNRIGNGKPGLLTKYLHKIFLNSFEDFF